MTRELYVIGLNEHHRPALDRLGRELGFTPRSLLPFDSVRKAKAYDIDALLAAAREQLDDSDAAGITTYWDFPSSCLAPMLAEELGLPTPGLASVATFEHKYRSRRIQQEVAPDDTPAFAPVDVHADAAERRAPLEYPFWLKPIKSYSSHLGFLVAGPEDLTHAVAVLRRRIGRLGEPFQRVLDRAGLSDEADGVGGTWAIAEEIIDGQQCTLEGHVHHGEPRIHGLFDIARRENGSSFAHYTYPSRLPQSARARMHDIATGLVEHVGYDQGPFNIEFFHDADTSRTWILEVNTRISQEHSDLMAWVDGATNLQVMAQTALGEEPELQLRGGPSGAAGKFFHRHDHDAVVARVPQPEEVAALEHAHAPAVVDVEVAEGDRLSELEDQDPYSYELAYLYLGARDHEALHAKHAEVAAALDFELIEPPA